MLSAGRSQGSEAYEDVSVPNLPGRLYEPAASERAGRLRPLIVALHGGGGMGTDNEANVRDFGDLLTAARDRSLYLYCRLPPSPQRGIRDEPVWAFPARDDGVIPVASTRSVGVFSVEAHSYDADAPGGEVLIECMNCADVLKRGAIRAEGPVESIAADHVLPGTLATGGCT